MGSMGMTRDGRLSSSLSKSSRSTAEALREYTLKLTPPGTTLAPSGELRPETGTANVAEAADTNSPSAQKFLCNSGHALRLESEFSLKFLQRRRGSKRRHSDHAALRADISLPSERGTLLDRDPRSDIRRQNGVAVLPGLILEDFPGRHGDYPG